MVERRARAHAAARRWARDDRREPSAAGLPAATRVADALVPGQEENASRAERPQEVGKEPGEEPVARRDVAVVHVVAEVGRDPDEARQPAGT